MLEKIKQIIMPVLEENSIIFKNIEYIKEYEQYFLRIYIDTNEGIDLNTIVEITPLISDVLDEHDIIDNEYILEISSPGAEPILETESEIRDAIGEHVLIELNNPVNDLPMIQGWIKDVDEEGIELDYLVKGVKKHVKIANDNIKLIRLAVNF